MRTNIEIDEEVMASVLDLTGFRTKREAVEAGLKMLAQEAAQAKTLELIGAVEWDGDLDKWRRDPILEIDARKS